MSKLRLAAIGAVSTTFLAAGSMGIVSAATQTNANANNGNVGTSGIPRTVFRDQSLNAASQVLNTSTSNITQARKDHTFKTLLKNDNLTRKQFDQKLKAQLTTDLENQGYSADQVTIALQHRALVHLHKHERKEHKQHQS